MDVNLHKSPKTFKHARDLLEQWKETYGTLEAQAFVVVLTYEQYLLNQTSSKELAKAMVGLVELLPDRLFSEDGEDAESGDKEKKDSGPQ